ncbi:uncharacterized protein NFIA_112810 [Aspergillus fischeri NRRL 181]|uniref:Polyketide synthase C-terminal extension domain-containing protein n=1 Tax=Neosartorya fischeri (strain ATCC 1020 / DSM 3700 / CBS 544.65 / FGSC A1164 / JCM 1740 / NRRL 181 / WB 181) TaxID=331117 RepID=A1D8P5_NEOFI|nr:uncharacterized protein NFIA_112810 [Aspergillus fischeri NRRL 181]EAW20756.1 hypothetical protein NFIA_112810 [Aspergillus fischeri NRRL 181]KAG2002095.1 hypothetical protein GB937_009761 [Aspergillus fischeri]
MASSEAGVPRCVSVNSFGFGGTNAHAILESYEEGITAADKPVELSPKSPIPVMLPFVFSASSVRALAAILEQYSQYLEDNPNVDLVDTAWTLLQRPSFLTHRIAILATTIDLLITRIREELALLKTKNPSSIVSSLLPTDGTKRILGVSTGQGAQWPQMGLDLITHCPEATIWLDVAGRSLTELPVALRPSSDQAFPFKKSWLHSDSLQAA